MPLTQVQALAYVVIESRAPQRWRSFLTEVVGVERLLADVPAAWDYYKMDAYVWRIAVCPGDKDALHAVGWEIDPAVDLDWLIGQLNERGCTAQRLSAEQCQQRRVSAGVGLCDPSGQMVELVQSCALDYLPLRSPVNVAAFETGFNGDMGLGHYVLPTRHLDNCVDFYRELLGFDYTDSMNVGGRELHFLHVDNPRHHSLAIYQHPQPHQSGCVHLMFEVKDLDEVGLFIDRCREHDVAITASLGKHCNDQMVSVYVESPGGFAIEYGCAGLRLDWQHYRRTFSTRPSQWGHHWQSLDNRN